MASSAEHHVVILVNFVYQMDHIQYTDETKKGIIETERHLSPIKEQRVASHVNCGLSDAMFHVVMPPDNTTHLCSTKTLLIGS